MGMNYERQLAIPAELKEMYPLTAKMNTTIQERRAKLESIFEGRDNRLILIIGPCSADNEDSVMDYIGRLVGVQENVADKIFIVPRIYTNKPTGFSHAKAAKAEVFSSLFLLFCASIMAIIS